MDINKKVLEGKKLRVKKILVVCIAALICIFNSNIVLASETNEAKMDYRLVDSKKEWRVTFSETLDLTSVEGNIYITDMYGNKLKDIELIMENTNTIVLKKIEPYKEGQIYTLKVESNIKDINNHELKNGQSVVFKIGENQGSEFGIKEIKKFEKNIYVIEFTSEINETAEVPLFYNIILENGDFIKGSYDNISVEKMKNKNNAVILTVKNSDINQSKETLVGVLGELKDKFGNRMNDGIDNWEMVEVQNDADRFEAAGFKFINDRLIQIDFNRMLDVDYAENEMNLRVFEPNGKGVSIQENRLKDESKIIVKLEKAITEIGQYQIEIKNMRDFTKNSYIKNKKYNFEIDSIRENQLEFEVKTINNRVLEVVFQEPVNKHSATNIMYYWLHKKGEENNAYIPMKLFFDQKSNDRVRLYYNHDLSDESGYYLKISRLLKNIYNESYKVDAIRNIEPSNKEYSFEIDDINVKGNFVYLNFTNEILEDSDILFKSLYELELNQGNGRKVSIECNGVEVINGVTLKLRFDGMYPEEQYKLTTPKIRGYFGGEIDNKYGINIIKEK